jgi:hypothetical protein
VSNGLTKSLQGIHSPGTVAFTRIGDRQMQESPPYSIGQIARFRYPKSNNLNNLRPIYADRSVLITSVRDVARSGLHPVSLMKRPMKARGRWLITGLCLDTHQERSFYVESMLEHKRDTWLTFGLFDPAEPNIEISKTNSRLRFSRSTIRLISID